MMPARGAVSVGVPGRLSTGSQRPTGCRQEALAQTGFGLTVSGFAGLMPGVFNDTSNNCSQVRSLHCDLKLLKTFGPLWMFQRAFPCLHLAEEPFATARCGDYPEFVQQESPVEGLLEDNDLDAQLSVSRLAKGSTAAAARAQVCHG